MQAVQKTQPRILGKLIGLLLARLGLPLASFLVIVLIARMWAKPLLGEYSTIYTWFTIFHYFSLFGIGEFISKEIGAHPASASKYLAHGLLFGVLSSVVCGVIMVGGAILFNYNDNVEYGIFVLALALPASVASIICISVFTAFQAIRLIAFTSVLQSSLFLLLGSTVIIKGYGLIALVWCLVVAWVVASVANIFIAHRCIARVRVEIDWDFLRGLLGPIIAFGLTGLAGQIFMRIDIIMLSKIMDMNAVALYTPASKMLEMSLMLPLTFYVLILPIAAGVLKDFRKEIPEPLESYARLLFIFVFLEFGLVFFFAESILSFIYGNAYVEAAGVLRILMLSLLFLSSEMILVMCCQAGGFHKVAMHFSVGRTIGKVLLNFVLIPIWGPLGAALATFISIAISFAVLKHYVKRYLGSFRWIHMVREPAFVCGFVMFTLFLLADYLNTLYLGLLFLAGYTLLLFGVKRFQVERLRRIWR